MLKNILKKRHQKTYKYSPIIHYDITKQSYKQFANYPCAINDKPCSMVEKGQIKSLVDDFYFELYSLKNLPKMCFYLMRFSIPTLFFVALYFAISEAQSDKFPFLSFSLTLLTTAVFAEFRERNEKIIINKQSQYFKKKFTTIDEVRIFWLRDRIGNKAGFYETATMLAEWKSHKDKYNLSHKIDWLRYIYDPESKPRILALFIASVSIFTLITINAFKIDPMSVFIALAGIKFFLTDSQGISLTIFIIFIICIFFWQAIFFWHILSRFSMYIYDYFNKTGVSRLRFSILMNFLLDHIDIKNDKPCNTLNNNSVKSTKYKVY